MVIKYTLTEEDYIKSNIEYIKFSDNFRKQVMMIKISMTVILFLMSLLFVKGKNGVILGLVLGTLEFLFFEKYYALSTSWKIKKVITNDDLQFYMKGVSLETSPYGFTIEGKGKKLRYKWSDVNLIGDTKDRLYLFTDKGISEIVPKRDCNAEELKVEIIDPILKVGCASLKVIK